MPRAHDLTGQRFGRLMVLQKTDRRDGSNIVYECRCDCGKIVYASNRALRSGAVQSCGCLRREQSVHNFAMVSRSEKLGQVDGTNLSRIASKKPQRNNTSGVRGVAPCSKGWVAYIYFRGQRYHLYSGPSKDKAILARKEAESHLFGRALDAYNHKKAPED